MTEKLTRWDAADHLKSEEDMVHYLKACLKEDSGDGRLIRAALDDIARARAHQAELIEEWKSRQR